MSTYTLKIVSHHEFLPRIKRENITRTNTIVLRRSRRDVFRINLPKKFWQYLRHRYKVRWVTPAKTCISSINFSFPFSIHERINLFEFLLQLILILCKKDGHFSRANAEKLISNHLSYQTGQQFSFYRRASYEQRYCTIEHSLKSWNTVM